MTLHLEPVRSRLAEPLKGEVAFAWLCRALAIYAIGAGLFYAARMLGLDGEITHRFDVIDNHWRVAGVVLTLLFPAAGLGLWMLSSWGGVLWCAGAMLEIVMYTAFADLYGHKPLVALVNVVISIAYVTLSFWLFIQEKKRRQNDQE